MGSLDKTLAEHLLYEELTGEVQRMLSWIKCKKVEAEDLEKKRFKNRLDEGVSKISPQTKEFLHNVRLYINQVQGLITEAFSYLERDPDTLLYIGVTDLEKSWLELKSTLRCLSRGHLNITPSSPVNLYFVKQGSPVSPLYNKIPFYRERKVTVELPNGRSLLTEKGRTQVAKLSIPYRALIKSKVKNHWHRSKSLDTKSDINSSDTKSEVSDNLGKELEYSSNVSNKVKNLISKIKDKSQNGQLQPSCNLGSVKSFGNLSNMDLDTMKLDRSASSSPQSNSRLGARLSPPMEEESPNFKRRKMNNDTPSSVSSERGSPSPMFGPHVFVDPAHPRLDDMKDVSYSPTDSPSPNHSRDFTRTVKKAELWPSIKSDYQFLMDEEIIATCKSTESDFSCTEEEGGNKVSFAEFIQQFSELVEWLKVIQRNTHRQGSSLSEKYLNQSYHKEMMHNSSRHRLFQDYAKQLQRRYPDLKTEISLRVQQLNLQWKALEDALCPDVYTDEKHMLNDLESDLNSLKTWLNDMEYKLSHTTYVDPSWSIDILKTKLQEHTEVQQDIESHSKIVSAVLKLCERLKLCEPLLLVVKNLQTRWHAIWIKSLEWQCRLEEALVNEGKVPRRLFLDYSDSQSPEISRDGSIDCVDIFELQNQEFDDDDDNCLSDIIPFSDSEYEKIVVESDSQTEGFVDSPPDLGRMIDSALGKSVSDHSDGGELLLKNAGMIIKNTKSKMESHDIGYSSESHSNEEQELKKVEGEPDVIEEEDEGASVNTGMLTGTKLGSQSRHSMTSAYDTSSNCSDHAESAEGEGDVAYEDKEEDAEQSMSEATREKVERLCNSPSQQFYKVTTVEGECDIENGNAATSGTSKIRKENTTDDFEYTDIQVRSTSTPQKTLIPIIHTNAATADWADEFEELGFSDDGEICQAFNHSEEYICGSLSMEAISDVSHQDAVLSSYEETEGEPDRNTPPPVNTSVKKLIQEAELLVMDERLVEAREMPKVKNSRSRKRKASQKNRKAESRDGSVASSEGEESCPSSCEACSEYTTGSDSEGEWSSDMSDLGASCTSDDLPAKIRRKSKKHGGSSILSMELSQYSISESAIDDINKDFSPSVGHLRKCISDTTDLERRRRRNSRRCDSRSTMSGSSSVFDDSSLCVVCPVVAESTEDLDEKDMVTTSGNDMVTTDNNTVTGSACMDTLTSAPESIDIAWDDYQAAPYSFSDAPKLEDKLDEPMWEEFDVEGDETLDAKQSSKLCRKRQPRCYDSDDSDIEDLVHLLTESKQQLRLAADTIRKDQLDPASYREVVATCKTNITCLDDIKNTVVEGLNIDAKQVQDIIDQWRELEVLASVKEDQAKNRYGICQELLEVDDVLTDFKDLLESQTYTSVDDLVTHIQLLQQQKPELTSCHEKVLDISKKMDKISTDHSSVTNEEFMKSLCDLQQRIDQLQHSCDQRISVMKNLVLEWYELNELQRELDYLMEEEGKRLSGLIVSQDDNIADKISDLKLMQEAMEEYYLKVDSMRQNCSHLEKICSEEATDYLRAIVSQAEMECSGMDYSIQTLLLKLQGATAKTKTAMISKTSTTSFMQVVIPLSLAVIITYLLFPEFWDRTFGLTLEPQLRYINGPPPT